MSGPDIHSPGPVVLNQRAETCVLEVEGSDVTVIRRSAVADLLQAAPFRLLAACAAIGCGLGLGLLLPALLLLVALR